MTDEDGFRIEAAEQFGFSRLCSTDPVYRCTEAQLIAFAKACERKGLTEASVIAGSELRNVSLLMSNPPQSSAAWDIRNAINEKVENIDAEIAPILEAERQRCLSEQKFCSCGAGVELCPGPDGKPLCAESDT